MNKLDVVILAGGLGTRLSEYTGLVPKPMVKINNKPILMHIVDIYSKYKLNNFYIAAGYKANVIKNYFNKICIKKKKNQEHNYFSYLIKKNITINVVDTGLNTLTGGRLLRLKNIINKPTFFLTYGDGLSNINIKKLYNFHIRHKKICTVSAVRPPARFGMLNINKSNKVNKFDEKNPLSVGWINGGFFIINDNFFNYLKNDNTILEREPLEKVASDNQLMAFKHNGFWQCMDTKRDKDNLEILSRKTNVPWL